MTSLEHSGGLTTTRLSYRRNGLRIALWSKNKEHNIFDVSFCSLKCYEEIVCFDIKEKLVLLCQRKNY